MLHGTDVVEELFCGDVVVDKGLDGAQVGATEVLHQLGTALRPQNLFEDAAVRRLDGLEARHDLNETLPAILLFHLLLKLLVGGHQPVVAVLTARRKRLVARSF